MAFDQTLEADRIDGFNIFSAFVRVPLLVLGGILGGDDSASTKNIDGDALSNHGILREDSAESGIFSSENNVDDQVLGKATDSTRLMMNRRTSSIIPIPNNSVAPDPSGSEIDHNIVSEIKRTKKMSWSDESGLPLVYENDESISHQEHKISPYTAATGSYQKPTKSAMRKSRSIRQNSNLLSEQDKSTAGTQSRYIPNMNPRTAGNGLIMPTRPYGRYTPGDNKMLVSSSGGTESPQWGWYINTTPPTPELYYNRSISQSFQSSATIPKNQLVKVDPTKNVTQTSTRDVKLCQNQVFQNLQNSTKTNPVGGWTSIPI